MSIRCHMRCSIYSKAASIMATAKFIQPSPYSLPQPDPPESDYRYKLFEEHLALQLDELTDRPINVAVFGVGRAGTIHLASLVSNPRVRILYVADNIKSKQEALRAYWSLNATTFVTIEQSDIIYNDSRVDAIIVCSPTSTHEKIILSALKYKKAVFCEKPLTSTLDQSIRCYEAAHAAGKPLFCAFNRRFDPSYNNARERVMRGEIGHVQIIKVVTKSSPLASIGYLEQSGGIFHDLMTHVIDLMIWVLAEFPEQVSVHAHAHIPEVKTINDYDVVVATFVFPSGTLGMIDVARYSSYGADQRLEVFGPKGLITVASERPMYSVETQYGLNGVNTTPNYYNFASLYQEAYQREMNHFLDVAREKVEPIVHYKEALAVTKIATACEESARSGEPVNLVWEEDEIPKRDVSINIEFLD